MKFWKEYFTSTPVSFQGKIFEWCSNELIKTTIVLRVSLSFKPKTSTSLLIAPVDPKIIEEMNYISNEKDDGFTWTNKYQNIVIICIDIFFNNCPRSFSKFCCLRCTSIIFTMCIRITKRKKTYSIICSNQNSSY